MQKKHFLQPTRLLSENFLQAIRLLSAAIRQLIDTDGPYGAIPSFDENAGQARPPTDTIKTPEKKKNQRTNGPVNAHLISWPSKVQNIQNLENIW